MSAPRLAWPLPSAFPITQRFGQRMAPTFQPHNGIDLGCPSGTRVLACARGIVVGDYSEAAGGNVLELGHEGGYRTVYAHLSLKTHRQGDVVNTGDTIALSGATGFVSGAHLHLGLRDPSGTLIDPAPYLEMRPGVQPAPSDTPDAFPLNGLTGCPAGYQLAYVDPRIHVIVPGSPWFGHMADTLHPDQPNACVRSGVPVGTNLAVSEASKVLTAGAITFGLNAAIVLLAVAFGWQGIRQIASGVSSG